MERKTEIVMRKGAVVRNTLETQISLEWSLDGEGLSTISTGQGFLDHMLTLLGRHSNSDLVIKATGDLYVDAHHTTEDVGIALGTALKEALGTKAGIRRYGCFTLPMDETLVTVAVDLGGRPFYVSNAKFPTPRVGDFDTELVDDFWQGFSTAAMCNLHVKLEYGRNSHHIAEAIFKCAARALRMAWEIDPNQKGVPTTKGVL